MCVCVFVTLVAQDLAQFVNEVKRDNETLREIDQYQRSIENLVSLFRRPAAAVALRKWAIPGSDVFLWFTVYSVFTLNIPIKSAAMPLRRMNPDIIKLQLFYEFLFPILIISFFTRLEFCFPGG